MRPQGVAQQPAQAQPPGRRPQDGFFAFAHRSLPAGVVLFGEPDQILNLNVFAVICHDMPVIAPEHLVHFAEDNLEIGLATRSVKV
jgi:hypothetical protein